MSVAYLQGIQTLMTDGFTALDASGAPYKGVLLNSSHVEDETDGFLTDVNANEISQAPAHVAIASVTISVNVGSTRVELDAADFSFASVGAGDVPAYLVIYYDTGVASTSPLICSLSLQSPPTPDGGSWTAVLPTNGFFHFQNSP